MLALSIETSCDETSLAFLYKNELEPNSIDFYTQINSYKVLAGLISSQIKLHQPYGGVVPEIGARAHASQIHSLLHELLEEAWSKEMALEIKEKCNSKEPVSLLKELDYIFVTTNPGLPSALKVGVEFAKTLSFFINEKYQKVVEVTPVNHLHGHLVSCFYQPDL